MPKANIGNGEIYYEVHGEGPPLLLVAGLGGTGDYWKPQIEALAKHYTVILHDHRGTGQSSHSQIEYSVDQMADDVLRLMDFLKIEQAHFVGHSTGGAMALILAVEKSRTSCRYGRLRRLDQGRSSLASLLRCPQDPVEGIRCTGLLPRDSLISVSAVVHSRQ